MHTLQLFDLQPVDIGDYRLSVFTVACTVACIAACIAAYVFCVYNWQLAAMNTILQGRLDGMTELILLIPITSDSTHI